MILKEHTDISLLAFFSSSDDKINFTVRQHLGQLSLGREYSPHISAILIWDIIGGFSSLYEALVIHVRAHNGVSSVSYKHFISRRHFNGNFRL